MSALQRLKAYFGMVPADDYDDEYEPDYGPDYGPEYRSDYDGYQDDPADQARERAYSGPRRSQRFTPDYPTIAPEPAAAAGGGKWVHSGTHRPSWAADNQQVGQPDPAARVGGAVRGSLAVDTSPSREPRTAAHQGVFAEDEAHPLARIVTLHPKSYHEARPIGERYREGIPVIINLTGMEDKDARRLVDFAAGLAFALRGSIDKVTNKVFLLSPPDVDVSAEDRRRIVEGGLFRRG